MTGGGGGGGGGGGTELLAATPDVVPVVTAIPTTMTITHPMDRFRWDLLLLMLL